MNYIDGAATKADWLFIKVNACFTEKHYRDVEKEFLELFERLSNIKGSWNQPAVFVDLIKGRCPKPTLFQCHKHNEASQSKSIHIQR